MRVTREQIPVAFTLAKRELINKALSRKGLPDPNFGLCAALNSCCINNEIFKACVQIIHTRLDENWLQHWLEQRGYDWRNNPEKLYQCRLDWLDSLIAEFAE